MYESLLFKLVSDALLQDRTGQSESESVFEEEK